MREMGIFNLLRDRGQQERKEQEQPKSSVSQPQPVLTQQEIEQVRNFLTCEGEMYIGMGMRENPFKDEPVKMVLEYPNGRRVAYVSEEALGDEEIYRELCRPDLFD